VPLSFKQTYASGEHKIGSAQKLIFEDEKLSGRSLEHRQLIHAVVDNRGWRNGVRKELKRHGGVKPNDRTCDAMNTGKVRQKLLKYLVAIRGRTEVGSHHMHIRARANGHRERRFRYIKNRLLNKEYPPVPGEPAHQMLRTLENKIPSQV